MSAFDGFGRETCRVFSAKAVDSGKANSISFQNIARARERVREQFGVDACEAIFTGMNAAPQHAVRVDVRRISAEEAMREIGVTARRSTLLEDVLICESGCLDDPHGRWFTQSESSCIPVDLLDPPDHALDLRARGKV